MFLNNNCENGLENNPIAVYCKKSNNKVKKCGCTSTLAL